MPQNDPGQNNLVKICRYCAYPNNVSHTHCMQCGKSLAGIKGQLESSLTAPLQEPPADEEAQQRSVAGMPTSQLNTQQTLVLGQLSTIASGQNTHGASILARQPDKQPLNDSIPGVLPQQAALNGNSSARTKSKRKRVAWLVIALVALLVIAALLFTLLPSFLAGSTSSLNSLGEFKVLNGELLGINDGSFAPFLLGQDKQEIALKQQAADQIQQGHRSQAISLLESALHRENNDPEAWIYLENQLMLLSGSPYETLVVGASGFNASNATQSALQGIYVAQHEFNNGNHGFRLRILIANSGGDINNVAAIAQQIVRLAQHDKTVVGVISWLTSAETINALPILSNAHIPLIAPTASSDKLTNISSFFFRIIPPNRFEGKASALFAEQTLHAQKVVVFVDNNDPYSQNLAQDFEEQFIQDKGVILKEEPFITAQTSKISDLIQDALKAHPDMLYFTGRETSDVTNFQDALPPSGIFAQLPALSGDAGYVIHKAGYGRWYFASFAFANALDNVIGKMPPFYQEYSDDFNQDGLKPPGYYGYTRSDDNAMLSYDVTSVFLAAMQMAIGNNKIVVTSTVLQAVTPDMVASTLPHVVLQGVSGRIAFGTDHNPINKAIVFLAASLDGHTYMKDWRGCFTKDLCRNAG